MAGSRDTVAVSGRDHWRPEHVLWTSLVGRLDWTKARLGCLSWGKSGRRAFPVFG